MIDTRMSLAALNGASASAFAAATGSLFEDAPWITRGLAASRPFASLTALHAAMMDRLHAADTGEKLAFLRGHPMLSPTTLRQGTTPESTLEQRSMGMDALDEATAAQLDAANAAHLAQFGFPFILAVRHASLPTILGAMERRLRAAPYAEITEALREVEAISWMRLLDRVAPAPTGVTLHVLDTARSRPAMGLQGALWQCPPESAPMPLARFATDANGRAAKMLGDGDLTACAYEWQLDTAAYFARHGAATPDCCFLPAVCMRFSVWNPEEHFHVPVLLTMGSYTTYRGS